MNVICGVYACGEFQAQFYMPDYLSGEACFPRVDR
jgi:hypothetical protein